MESEKEIAEYGIAAGQNDGELAGYVNEMIQLGWQPYGFPFTTTQMNILFFHQSMVRYHSKKKVQMTIKEILEQCTIEENIVKLPAIEIPRPLAGHVNKKIEEIGGEWVEDKNGFEFVTDPAPILAAAISKLSSPQHDEPAIVNTHTNFFQQLSALGHVDITIRILQKDDKMTMNIMPGTKTTIQPFIVTGTALELDQEFFNTIAPGLSEIKGIVSNLAEVKADAADSKSEKGVSNPAKKSTVSKKSTVNKKVAAKKSVKPAAAKKDTPKKAVSPKKQKVVVEKKTEETFVPMFPE